MWAGVLKAAMAVPALLAAVNLLCATVSGTTSGESPPLNSAPVRVLRISTSNDNSADFRLAPLFAIKDRAVFNARIYSNNALAASDVIDI